MQFEIVEVDVSPAAAFLVHEADENFLAQMFMQVHNDRPQILAVVTGGFENDFVRVGTNEFHTGILVRATGDQEARERLRKFEPYGCKRALRLVSADFKSADPIVAAMLAFHIAPAAGDCVALNGLFFKGDSLSRPVFEGARLEIEIEGITFLVDRAYAG